MRIMKRRITPLAIRSVSVAGGLASCLLSVMLAGAAEPPKSVLEAEQRRVEAIEQASRAAICVFARGGQGGGSGVVITPDGYALTNFHVAKPCGEFMQCSMNNGVLYDAVIVGIDPGGDVALIKLLGHDDFPTAEMGDSDKLRVGDWCFAVGNPFLLATDFQPTVSYGLVSGVHRYQYPAGTLLEYADCIQTDAAINPGNSGGPLFNAQGQLVGINGRGSFEKRGRVNVGVGYAISINQIKKFLGHLRSGRIIDHATLGATVASSESGSVVVSNILNSSDAYRRGLRYGDEIVAFGGRRITTVNGFKNALGIFPRGWRIPLSYRRDGESKEILVRLAGVHSPEELIQKVQKRPAPTPPDHKPGDEPKKPGEKPGDQKPGPKKPGRPTGPKRGPPPIPEHVKPLIEVRPGFTNRYFNRLEVERVWKGFVSTGEFESRNGEWQLAGSMANGGSVQVTLNAETAKGAFPTGEFTVDPNSDLSEQLLPRNSGGVGAAMLLWRRMLTLGPKRFGDAYYLGKAPLRGHQQLTDVVFGAYDVAENYFYFDSESGQLLAIEMFPDVEVDPCEIYFQDYREVDGRMLPHRLEVRYGDQLFGVIQCEKWTLSPVAEKGS